MVHSALARTYVQKYVLTKDRAYSDRAVQAAERSRVLAPDSPDVLLALANVQRLTGRAADAIATFKRALALQPNSPESVIWLATSYQSNGQMEEAERAFKRGIALRPSWWSGHNELGVMYLAAGRLDDAGREFARVIDLNPKSPWGYSNLGVVHVMKQRLPEAIQAFNKAVAIRDDPSAHANLAYCFYYLGQYDKSALAYRKAIDLRPKFAGNWANLADACRWTKTCPTEVEAANARAIELLNEELAVNPRSSRAHAVLAVCLAKRGESREAQHHIQEALQLEPRNPSRMFQAARVANFSGDLEGAVTWLRRAVEAGYGDFEVQRDPEFQKLRETEAFRAAFRRSPEPT
jgi:tetratricopeptide (TPR) repeat protein